MTWMEIACDPKRAVRGLDSLLREPGARLLSDANQGLTVRCWWGAPPSLSVRKGTSHRPHLPPGLCILAFLPLISPRHSSSPYLTPWSFNY